MNLTHRVASVQERTISSMEMDTCLAGGCSSPLDVMFLHRLSSTRITVLHLQKYSERTRNCPRGA